MHDVCTCVSAYACVIPITPAILPLLTRGMENRCNTGCISREIQIQIQRCVYHVTVVVGRQLQDGALPDRHDGTAEVTVLQYDIRTEGSEAGRV